MSFVTFLTVTVGSRIASSQDFFVLMPQLSTKSYFLKLMLATVRNLHFLFLLSFPPLVPRVCFRLLQSYFVLMGLFLLNFLETLEPRSQLGRDFFFFFLNQRFFSVLVTFITFCLLSFTFSGRKTFPIRPPSLSLQVTSSRSQGLGGPVCPCSASERARQ